MIEALNIEKSFGNLKVLKGIDFRAEKSEVVSYGSIRRRKVDIAPDSRNSIITGHGTLRIDGTDVLSLGRKQISEFRNRRIGFVFQFHHLLPEFTSVENVMIPA